MMRRKNFRIPICVLLSLLMLLDSAVFTPAPVHAIDKKSVAIGAGVGLAAGAGMVLAAPAIGTALGLGGAGLAGVGAAIAGGLAAAGGMVLGAMSAVGAAIAGGVGLIAGWVVGLVCSPLFIPALVVIGACVAGYLLYKHYKNKKQQDQNGNVIPDSDKITVTPGDYDMNPVLPPMNQSNPITIGDSDCINLPGRPVARPSTGPTAPVAPVAPVVPVAITPVAPAFPAAPVSNETLKDAEARYRAAYNKYTTLVSTGGNGDVQASLKEYRDSYKAYMDLKLAGSR
ncbi:MAG: hypothetical protein HQM09_16815 [Candidatus Riflebacteria bacterium]|nr:hypothetical protein [Candidatus Riflebacteria bacterium]